VKAALVVPAFPSSSCTSLIEIDGASFSKTSTVMVDCAPSVAPFVGLLSVIRKFSAGSEVASPVMLILINLDVSPSAKLIWPVLAVKSEDAHAVRAEHAGQMYVQQHYVRGCVFHGAQRFLDRRVGPPQLKPGVPLIIIPRPSRTVLSSSTMTTSTGLSVSIRDAVLPSQSSL
jgi:hypothetical protein